MPKATASYVQVTLPEDGADVHPSLLETYKKIGMTIARPVVDAVKRENPETIAKLAVAALAPQIFKSGLRLVARHPVLAVAGLAGFSIWLGRTQQASA